MAKLKAAMPPDVAKALARVSGGLYVVTAAHGDARSAMIASWVAQASFEPLGLTVAVAKDRAIESFMQASLLKKETHARGLEGREAGWACGPAGLALLAPPPPLPRARPRPRPSSRPRSRPPTPHHPPGRRPLCAQLPARRRLRGHHEALSAALSPGGRPVCRRGLGARAVRSAHSGSRVRAR